MKQFIEKDLDLADKTFARLAAGIIEEVEAITIYQQRIAVEEDQDVIDVLVAAQTEEMKHFAMQLELLLRRDQTFRTICQTVLFCKGNVPEAGVAAEKKVEDES